MIKKISISLLLAFTLFSCTFNKHPEFVGISNLKILDKNLKTFTLSVDAKFNNPNDLGGTLQTNDLRVIINNIDVATIKTEAFSVPRKKEFTIPLTAKVLTNDLINTNSISGILNSLKNKTLKVNYKGVINYTLAGFTYPYKVDYSEDIKL